MANNKLFDRVKMSVSGTPGTGTITLGSAATGYRSFSGAGVANGNVVSYLIEDGANWEFGTGTYYTSSGTTLSRDTVTASSAGGTTKISATSAAYIYITALTADLVQFDSAGNVGIGTSSPTSGLDIYNKILKLSETSGSAVQAYSYAGGGEIDFSSSSGAVGYYGSDIGYLFIGVVGSIPIIFEKSGAGEFMRITSAGDVGIGTTVPGTLLSVYKGTGTSQFQVGASSNYYWDISRDNDTTGALIVSYKNGGSVSEAMRIDSAGNVGIGVSSPSAVLELKAGTATVSPLKLTSGTNLTTPVAGAVEFDGNNFYATPDTSQKRLVVNAQQQFYLSSAGSAFGATIGNYFGSDSAASLAASSTYDIEIFCYFLKTSAGTLTWAPTFSSNATVAHAYLEYTPVTGFTTSNISGAMVAVEATQQTVGAMTFAATASLTTAVYHIAKFRIMVVTNSACDFRLNVTQSAGTITPQAGSFYTVRKVVTQSGNFVA